jgi:hypothetical protein
MVDPFLEEGDPLLKNIRLHIGKNDSLIDLFFPILELGEIFDLFDLKSVFLQNLIQAEPDEFILIEDEGIFGHLLHILDSYQFSCQILATFLGSEPTKISNFKGILPVSAFREKTRARSVQKEGS